MGRILAGGAQHPLQAGEFALGMKAGKRLPEPRGQRIAQHTRQSADALRNSHRAVAVVPAEELITAITGERDLHVLAGFARKIVRGQRR